MSGRSAFKFKKSIWERLSNSADPRARYFSALAGGLLIVFAWPIYKGIQHGRIEDYKRKWIKTEVRDIKNTEFSILDEEDSPTPLEPRTGLQQFRAEFIKINR